MKDPVVISAKLILTYECPRKQWLEHRGLDNKVTVELDAVKDLEGWAYEDRDDGCDSNGVRVILKCPTCGEDHWIDINKSY